MEVLKHASSNSESTLVRALISTTLAVAALLLWAPAALADSSSSSNWAGYAVHRAGISFRKISATWQQPGASCVPGSPSYSAFWIGLGGFNQSSDALEQIGTETDCSPDGTRVLSAWYELVPAPSQTIQLAVGAGDQVSASVGVSGHQVTLSLQDLTRRRGFLKTLHASLVDISSAEWIVEAPSECLTVNACQTLPLADFGTAAFSSAKAVGLLGHPGSIASGRWSFTKITLMPGGRRFAGYQGYGGPSGAAVPSALQSGGSAFSVDFAPVPSTPTMTPRAALAADVPVPAGRLFH